MALNRPRPHATLTLSPTTTVTRVIVNAQQTRTFFWWNYRSQDWSSYLDVNFQKHMKRRQRRLMYKYSKSLRRKELWERDASHDSHRHPWGWRLSSSWGKGRWVDDDRLSSLRSKESDLKQEPKSWNEEYDLKRAKAVRAYLTFKEKIDSDPYRALFGRSAERLYGYTSLGRQWSPLSWCLGASTTPGKVADEPREHMQDTNGHIVKSAQGQAVVASSSNMASKSPVQSRRDDIEGRASRTSDEYVYDPISMRKVLRKQASAYNPDASILAASEGPIDISVKTHKTNIAVTNGPEESVHLPVKTFIGYHVRSNSPKLAASDSQVASQAGNGPSRVSESHGDGQSTGGSIIYSARPDEGSTSGSLNHKSSRYNPTSTATTTPSSSVTTTSTAARARASLGLGVTAANDVADSPTNDLRHQVPAVQSHDWLTKERFGSKPSKSKPSDIPAPDIMEDREKVSAGEIEDLRPLSHQSQSISNPSANMSRRSLLNSFEAPPTQDEDVDLLRTSDIRASVKSARMTKSEHDTAKKDRRERLEADFTLRYTQPELPLSRDDIMPEKVLERQGRTTDNTNASRIEETRNHALSPARLTPNLPSLSKVEGQAIQKETSESDRRMAKLQRLSQIAERKQDKSRMQLQRLATEFREIYEDTYGIVDVKHRQVIAHSDRARDNPTNPAPLPTPPSAVDVDATEAVKSWYEARKERALADEAATAVAGFGPDPSDHNQIFRALRVSKSLLKEAEQTLGEMRTTQKDLTAHRNRESNFSLTRAICELEQKGYLDGRSAAEAMNRITCDHLGSDGHAVSSGHAATPATSTTNTTSLAPVSSPSNSSMYKILAYDTSSLQMTIADTSCSTTPSTNPDLPPTEVLSRLNTPARFLPYFAQMQEQGYEIVSGGGDMLVFKKVQEAVAASTPQNGQAAAVSRVSSTTTSKGDDSKPRMVKREEDRFSGSNRKWQDELQEHFERGTWDGKQERGLVKGIQRVILTGLVFAAICYAIGAIAESFRLAEQDESEVDEAQDRKRGAGRPGIFRTEDSR